MTEDKIQKIKYKQRGEMKAVTTLSCKYFRFSHLSPWHAGDILILLQEGGDVLTGGVGVRLAQDDGCVHITKETLTSRTLGSFYQPRPLSLPHKSFHDKRKEDFLFLFEQRNLTNTERYSDQMTGRISILKWIRNCSAEMF